MRLPLHTDPALLPPQRPARHHASVRPPHQPCLYQPAPEVAIHAGTPGGAPTEFNSAGRSGSLTRDGIAHLFDTVLPRAVSLVHLPRSLVPPAFLVVYATLALAGVTWLCVGWAPAEPAP